MMRPHLLAAALALASGTSAAVLEVGVRRQFASLPDALAAARPGDVIRLGPGLYTGNLVIHTPITIEGEGRPVIRGSGSGSVISVLADACTLHGLVIEHSGNMLSDEDSGILLKSNGNRIESNEMRDVLYGIYLYHSDRNVVARNTIRGRPELGLGERGAGIHVWNSSENRIEDNLIRDTRDGMYLQNAYRSAIRRNRAFDLRYGLHYMFSDDNVFEDNVFHDSVAGAAIMYSKRISLRRNAFVRNRRFSAFGILFQDSDDCIAENNTVADNGVGLFLEALRNSKIRANLIASNDTAMQVFMSASRNTFEQNNFVANLSPIQMIGSRTDNAWNGATAGNYWSDYDGYDLNGDGIGDVPHRIENVFAHLEGDRPRLRLFFSSPAAQALAYAERNFPVLQASEEIDRLPLMKPAHTASPYPDVGRSVRADWRWSALPGALGLAAALCIVRRRLR
jgi:nitrous oxidase accessory protein